jgi:hypothetical protein
MFARRKKLNAVWMVIATIATVSMVAYLLMPLFLAGGR